ncbi:MAG: Hsp20/alpha crystallin family protein [Thermoflavifilum sp.]|nr:Hsp20/alpha crystallin family protein [Thermoflavifilum sp.]MCL6515146.1 Hsp20/alpha crystallin family protein [Alicyclobacillus sp.]
MPLIPYDPLRWLERDAISSVWPRWANDPWFGPGFHDIPRVDVRETPTEVIVTAELPGLERKEDVHISVHEGHLHLSGRIERRTEAHDDHVHRVERFAGSFSRTVPLPAPVDENQARASYRNGVLEVRLPKKTHTQGRAIDVEFH